VRNPDAAQFIDGNSRYCDGYARIRPGGPRPKNRSMTAASRDSLILCRRAGGAFAPAAGPWHGRGRLRPRHGSSASAAQPRHQLPEVAGRHSRRTPPRQPQQP